MNSWKKLAFQGKTFGLKDLSKKKRRKKDPLQKKLRRLRRKSPLISEGQMIQRDFDILLASPVVSEKTKLFLKKLRGSYEQFKRFTPRQFEVFKKIWWEMKDRVRKKKKKSESNEVRPGGAFLRKKKD